jgi:hypothetical protein
MDGAGRLADAGRSLASGARSGLRGALRTAARGLSGLSTGTRELTAGRRGGSVLAIGLLRLLVQVPADALLLLLARTTSATQTLLGVEAPARPLDAGERDLLARVFGTGIDPRPVRVKQGPLGVLGLPRRAFVVADTVHTCAPASGSLAARAPALLVHELTHVWQHQRHGTRYMSECLLAQWLGEGYNVAVALAAGRSWRELNFEQQAELLEQAFTAGWFAGEEEPDAARLLLRLTDPHRDHGFEVRLEDQHDLAPLFADGWRDATPLLQAGLAEVRSARVGPNASLPRSA